jgi:hypothetical protein
MARQLPPSGGSLRPLAYDLHCVLSYRLHHDRLTQGFEIASRVLRKFQGDIGVLQRAAADIVRPFSEKPGFEVFARWFKGARERVHALRLVISNDAAYQATLTRLKLENLDNRILGGEFPEDTITVSGSPDHFGLMAAERVLRQVEELVTKTRKRRNLSGKPG